MKQTFGVRITDPFHLNGWQVVELAGTALESSDACPCCLTKLETAVEFVADAGGRMRLGACPMCEYAGYIDRPSQAWFQDFYNKQWDTNPNVPAQPAEFKPNPLISAILDLKLPTTSKVFEVGTGYGQLLRQMRQGGFSDLHGIEHSPHRAEAASKAAEANVMHGDFSDPEVIANIKQRGMFQIVFSKSVMEHMFDPRALFDGASEILEEGGVLAVTVPNVFREPTPGTLFFLPHLHAFSLGSLEFLAQSYGFESVSLFEIGNGVVIIARKKTAMAKKLSRTPAGTERLLEKWMTEFCVSKIGDASTVYWWGVTGNRWTGVFKDRGFLNPILFWSGILLRRIPKRYRAIRVKKAPAQEGVPITVYSSKLSLFYK